MSSHVVTYVSGLYSGRGVGERVRQTAQRQNPGFIPLGGLRRIQHPSRLAVSTSTMTLRRKKNVETLPATSQKTRSPWLSRLTACHEPSVYPAWRPAASPASIPLGGRPRAQHSSRLVVCREPSVHPAWRTSLECVTDLPIAMMKLYCKLFSH